MPPLARGRDQQKQPWEPWKFEKKINQHGGGYNNNNIRLTPRNSFSEANCPWTISFVQALFSNLTKRCCSVMNSVSKVELQREELPLIKFLIKSNHYKIYFGLSVKYVTQEILYSQKSSRGIINQWCECWELMLQYGISKTKLLKTWCNTCGRWII